MENGLMALISWRMAMAIVAVAAVFFVFVVVRTSALVSFPLTVALASGWCAWLEKHPEPSEPRRTRP